MDKKEISVSFDIKINCRKNLKLSDKEIQLLIDFKDGLVNFDGNEDVLNSAIHHILQNDVLSFNPKVLLKCDQDTIKITDIVHIDEPKERKDFHQVIVPVREVDGKLLMYEQDLPKMTDEEYNKWFNSSELVDGVRMGPIVEIE
jgi:hypothetical protein